MKKQHVKLSAKDRAYLESLISKGKLPAKTFKRATGLLELDRCKTLTTVAETLGVSYVTVAAWRDGYKKQGLKCLEDAPRPGRPPEIDGKLRAKITALGTHTTSAFYQHFPAAEAFASRNASSFTTRPRQVVG
jgi:putative transposase